MAIQAAVSSLRYLLGHCTADPEILRDILDGVRVGLPPLRGRDVLGSSTLRGRPSWVPLARNDARVKAGSAP